MVWRAGGGESNVAGLLADTINAIQPVNSATMQSALARQKILTKPEGSLGMLEEIAVKLAGISGTLSPVLTRRAIVVMAGAHGVCAEGVSAYPSTVTTQMVLNFVRGGAAINVLAAAAGAEVVIVDMGITDVLDSPAVRSMSQGNGTRNLAVEPAMSRETAESSIEAGIRVASELVAHGVQFLGTGDMGIGNTTSSSAIAAAITGRPVEDVTGRGTGVDDMAYARKVRVIRQALALHRPAPDDPIGILAAVGGFEIGGIAGVILGAASRHVPVVIDGFISGAGALLADGLAPEVRNYMFAAHRSVEQGHHIVLDRLSLRPLLDFRMRLGEGTGAALAMPIIDAASKIMREMATFASAGVDGPRDDIVR